MLELSVGELFEERYRITAELGRGGFGVVYSAVECDSERQVAIKILAASALVDPILNSRFERELRAIASLRDPHTVRLLTYGRRADGAGYLVLEQVPGEDLSELLRRAGRLPSLVVRHIASQVLRALREAHGAGIIHRDIKPQNIRVFGYGDDPYSVKLLDFGVSRSTDANHTSLTQTGALVGTPRYMAPEQLRGEIADARADIYALGLVVAELMAGADIRQGHGLSGQFERLRAGYEVEVPEGDDPELAKVVSKMCAFAPEQRYPSAQAVLAALDAPHDDRNHVPRLSLEAGRTETVRSRHNAKLSAFTAVAAGALIGFVVWLLNAREAVVAAPVAGVRPAPSLVRSSTESQESATTPKTPSVQVPPPTPINGCGADPTAGRQDRSAFAGITSHHWTRYVPTSYDPTTPQPLVVVLPPSHIARTAFHAISGFEEAAEKFGFVLITVDSLIDEAESFTLYRLAVDEERRELCLDKERIYIAGHGTGGHRALKLACEDKIAGVMVSSARPSRQFVCVEPQSVVLLSPLHSPRETVSGEATCMSSSDKLSLTKYEALWQEQNGCSSQSTEVFKSNGHQCVDYACELASFRHCTLNGGHPWPRTNGPVRVLGDDCDGPRTENFPAAEVVMEFFKKLSEQKDPDVPSNPPKTAR